MKISILYQDNWLMVIDKPAGMTVNRAETVGEKTVQDWAERNLKTQNSKLKTITKISKPIGDFINRGGIVHRLDKETSGCLIIAKTPEGFDELQKQFKNRQVKKEYLALVHGRVEPKQGTIHVPLARSRFDRQKFSVSAFGRPAETSYEVIFYIQHNTYSILHTPYSLLRLFPTTGRTHQIRVHLKYFGHPIVADEKYGGRRAKEDRQWCPRLCLHAAKISFAHPLSGKLLSIEAPLPPDLNKSIKYFRHKVSDTLHL